MRAGERVLGVLLSAPLAAPAGAIVAGISAESWLGWPGWAWPAAVVALLAAWLALRLRRGRLGVRLAVLIAVAFVLGGWRMALTRHALEPDHVAFQLTAGEQIVRLRCQVQTRPVLRSHTFPDFPSAMPRDPGSSFVVRADGLDRGDGRWSPAAGLVRVFCAGPALHVEPGGAMLLIGKLRPVGPAANPGPPDQRRADHDKRIFATMWLPHDSAAELSEAADPEHAAALDPGPSWRDALRMRSHGLLLGNAETLGPDEQSLLDGLVLGRRDERLGELARPFIRTGTYHYLAISGLHMGILAGFCWVLLRLLRVRPRRAALTVLAIVGLYCLMAEPRPPILRAGIMIGLACVGLLLHREVRSVNFLAAAAGLLLMLDPGELFGAGLQLSFVVVLGLLLFTGPVYRRMCRWVLRTHPNAPESAAAWVAEHPLGERAVRFVLQLLAVALVAWISGLPLVAWHFNRVYPWSVLCSVVLWPIVWLALMLGFSKMLVGAIVPTLAGWLNAPLQSVSRLLLATVNGLDGLPGMSLSVGRPGVVAVVASYAWLLLWLVRPRWLSARGMLVLGAGAALLLMLADSRHGGGLEVTTLSVGNGAANVVHTPDGRTLLIDCGSISDDDVGERLVAPFLADRTGWARSLRVDAAFVSHANFDHYNGLPALARRGILDRVVVSPGPPMSGASGRAIQRRDSLLRDAGVRSVAVSAGDRFRVGLVEGELLWPPPWVAEIGPKPVNDASQVVRLRFAGRSMLFTGDICEPAQQWLLEAAAGGAVDLRADVLVMPHHGAVVRNTDAFIRAVDPRWVLISTARPAEQIAPRCPALGDPGRRVLVTSQSGAITVRISPDGELHVEAFVESDQ